jgi:hypothetical protein
MFRYKGKNITAKITGVSKEGKLLLDVYGEIKAYDFKEVKFCL